MTDVEANAITKVPDGVQKGVLELDEDKNGNSQNGTSDTDPLASDDDREPTGEDDAEGDSKQDSIQANEKFEVASAPICAEISKSDKTDVSRETLALVDEKKEEIRTNTIGDTMTDCKKSPQPNLTDENRLTDGSLNLGESKLDDNTSTYQACAQTEKYLNSAAQNRDGVRLKSAEEDPPDTRERLPDEGADGSPGETGDGGQDDSRAPVSIERLYRPDDGSSGDSEPEDSNVAEGDAVKDNSTSKRRGERLKNEMSPSKKLRRELRESFQRHNTMLGDYIDDCTAGNVREMDRHAERLTAEIETLRDLARAAELEWNGLLRLKKVKEELLLRLFRKKAVALIEGTGEVPSGLVGDLSPEQSPLRVACATSGAGEADLVPTNGNVAGHPARPLLESEADGETAGHQRPTFRRMAESDGRTLSGRPRPPGRQGPTKDVRSIIADYRQRHPGEVPRRGRRARSILAPRIPHIGIGPRYTTPINAIAHVTHPGLFMGGTLSNSQSDGSIPPPSCGALTNGGMSFKDVLVQFASMAGRQPLPVGSLSAHGRLPPPPPYPEVTLHPVSSSSSLVCSAPPAPKTINTQTNSLLHGILTKACPRQESRFSAFSPTLARLLTAPEKAAVAVSTDGRTPDLANSQSCSEITITPVQSVADQPADRSRPEIVQLDDYEETEAEEDSADRPLVIDEGRSSSRPDARERVELNESEVPECQGCRRREAQFVCAGCANQWYCSRECQVSAWDDHSEICSG